MSILICQLLQKAIASKQSFEILSNYGVYQNMYIDGSVSVDVDLKSTNLTNVSIPFTQVNFAKSETTEIDLKFVRVDKQKEVTGTQNTGNAPTEAPKKTEKKAIIEAGVDALVDFLSGDKEAKDKSWTKGNGGSVVL